MDLEATARWFDCCPADDIPLCTKVKDDRSCINNIDLKVKETHLLSHCEHQKNVCNFPSNIYPEFRNALSFKCNQKVI